MYIQYSSIHIFSNLLYLLLSYTYKDYADLCACNRIFQLGQHWILPFKNGFDQTEKWHFIIMSFAFYRSSNMNTFEYFIGHMKYSSLTSFENNFQFSFCMDVIFIVECFFSFKVVPLPFLSVSYIFHWISFYVISH